MSNKPKETDELKALKRALEGPDGVTGPPETWAEDWHAVMSAIKYEPVTYRTVNEVNIRSDEAIPQDTAYIISPDYMAKIINIGKHDGEEE